LSNTEHVILVDTHDTPLGTAEKLAAHQQGQLHRAFSVCIIRQQHGLWQVLLQQRALTKYHSGGLWTNACCSHPRPDETIEVAATRRLQEEMGIQATLQEIGSFIYKAELDHGLTEHEFDHVLVGVFTGDTLPVNPEEVMAYRWIELAELQQQIQQQPAVFTAWLPQVIALVSDKLHG
jgi:isopentenyl-diphosphate delta-isomerase